MAWAQSPLSTAFTYQGELGTGSGLATGPYDLRFRLFDSLGAAVGTTQCAANVAVVAGRFTVELDFGAQFAGLDRYLEIAVRPDTGLGCANPAGFVTLAPRQRLTAAPNALFALNIPNPLTLSGTSATHIIRGANASTALGSIGVFGLSTGATGETYGVYGSTASTSGRAVFGISSASTGPADGVYGISNSTEGRGAVGWATAPSGTTYGVYGLTQSLNGRGVYGLASASTGVNYGVYGSTLSPNGYAGYFTGPAGSLNYFERDVGIGTTTTAATLHVVSNGAPKGIFGESYTGHGIVGVAYAQTGAIYGIWGLCNGFNPAGYGVYATGSLGASGAKSFRIDHPDDPANKYLLHYTAESPEVINFYRGTVVLDGAGEAVVGLPHYFAKINKDPSYQLTAVGAPMPLLHVVEKISSEALAWGAVMGPGEAAPLCTFRIAGGVPGGEVSWRVEAVRNDRYVQKHGAPVEVEKQAPEKGTYQHPELYGQPPEKGVRYEATHRHPEPAIPEPIAAAPR
jgi:hypothetical protein